MRELTAVKEFGATLDGADGPSPEARQRTLAQFHGTARSRRAGWGRLGHPGRLVLAGGLAAVVTGAVLVSQVVSIDHRPPASQAAAAQILRAAAAHEAAQPTPKIDPGRFVYVESIGSDVETRDLPGGKTEYKLNAKHRRIWLSVDGSKAGLLLRRAKGSTGPWNRIELPGCKNGKKVGLDGRPARGVDDAATCQPHAAFQADLPTEAGAMRRYLYEHSQGDNPRDVQAFITAGDLIRERYLTPAQLGAVFGALADVPGTKLVGAVTDEAGRSGVAIGMPEDARGTRSDLIFDAHTHAFLGERKTLTRAFADFQAGDVASSSANLVTAFVDRPGQLP
ncbi:hypothetical protein EV385_4675 [Krasilnikovia cinnamomea]|uniref:CU044_5270 family protein n=1 Tax=Krasilnikovia cinnamomea TaxID=349313 RepID=A0A4Q7ZPY9_9ACTN|nr:CU044_5270 family protein [Krasilnikovia cinnamomea]RZU52791.1 hypothetical protein EV385_4675 [Krasilnikovia cinnamomea]